jgi:hypothetical protein
MTSIVEASLAVCAGVPEAGADDHVAEPDPARRHGQGRQHAEGLEGDLVGRDGDGVEVVEDPQ